jgi:hypothetical protein
MLALNQASAPAALLHYFSKLTTLRNGFGAHQQLKCIESSDWCNVIAFFFYFGNGLSICEMNPSVGLDFE